MLSSAKQLLLHQMLALKCARSGNHATYVQGGSASAYTCFLRDYCLATASNQAAACASDSATASASTAEQHQHRSQWERTPAGMPHGSFNLHNSFLHPYGQMRTMSSDTLSLNPPGSAGVAPSELDSTVAEMMVSIQKADNYAGVDMVFDAFESSMTEAAFLQALDQVKLVNARCKKAPSMKTLPGNSEEAKSQAMIRLSHFFVSMLPQFSPLGTVDLLHAFAVMQHNPGKDAAGLLDIYDHIRLHALDMLTSTSTPTTYLIRLAWSMGTLCRHGERPVDEELFSRLAMALYPRINQLMVKELSMLTQAYADAGVYDWRLLDAASTSAKLKMHDIDPASAINIASSFAKLKFYDSEFLDMLDETLQLRLVHLNGSQLSKLCKAFASSKYPNEEFYSVTSKALQRRISELDCQQVANTAWAFTVRNHPDLELFNSLAVRAIQLIDHFKPAPLCLIIWSFGKLGFKEPLLLKRAAAKMVHILDTDPLSIQAIKAAGAGAGADANLPSPSHFEVGGAWGTEGLRVCDLDEAIQALSSTPMVYASNVVTTKNLCNLVWGFARSGITNEPLLKAVSARVKLMLKDPEGRIVDTLSQPGFERYVDGFGRLTLRYKSPEEEVSEVVLASDGTFSHRPADLNQRLFVSQNLSDLAWALASLNYRDVELYELIAARAMEITHMLGKTSIIDMASAFAMLEVRHAGLMSALEGAALPLLPDFGPLYLKEILWSMAMLQHEPSNDFLQLSMDLIWSKWERVTADHNIMASILWALVQLECGKRFPLHPLIPALNNTVSAMGSQIPSSLPAAAGAS